MPRLPTSRLASIAVVLLLGMTALAMEPPLSLDLAGTWVLHIDGGGYRQGIAILQVQTGACVIRSLPTRSWAGLRTDLLPVRSASCDDRGGNRAWHLELQDGRKVTLSYAVVDDTLLGTFTAPEIPSDHPAAVVGVRIPTSILPTRPAREPLEPEPGTAVVLLRLDDGFASDRDFLARLRQRGLPAELAIPTRLVGPDRLTWEELEAWRRNGYEPVAHSRFHRGKKWRWHRPGDERPLEFLGEVLGSLGDMAAHGYATDVFVQPGSWHDSLYFDSPAKLATWHGAVLRTFTRVFEGYARPWSVPLPLADSMTQGLGHFTISNRATPDQILEAWKTAQRPGWFTGFMVHTWSLRDPGQLDWFLDSLADAQRAGRIRLVRTSAEVAPLPVALSGK
ncbi:MAG TPA: hypothetical protein VMH88_15690 [Gemmatimonadales bacterium]|nr:hypothetical protein [Gemmatimonadales bacterium]